jgi:hypothetical protein
MNPSCVVERIVLKGEPCEAGRPASPERHHVSHERHELPVGAILKAGTAFKRGEKNKGLSDPIGSAWHFRDASVDPSSLAGYCLPDLLRVMQAGGSATLSSKRETISCIISRSASFRCNPTERLLPY